MRAFHTSGGRLPSISFTSLAVHPLFQRLIMQIKKTVFKRDKKYLDYIRSLPCAICKTRARSQAAHVRYIAPCGTGLKPSDNFTVPLCALCHSDQHNHGEENWWVDKKIDPKIVTDVLFDLYNRFENEIDSWSNAEEFVLRLGGVNYEF